MAHGAGAGAARSRGTGRGRCDSAGVAALRDGSGQGGSALHLLLHASWCGATRALSCRADRAAEEDVSGAGKSRSFASLRMTRLGGGDDKIRRGDDKVEDAVPGFALSYLGL